MLQRVVMWITKTSPGQAILLYLNYVKSQRQYPTDNDAVVKWEKKALKK